MIRLRNPTMVLAACLALLCQAAQARPSDRASTDVRARATISATSTNFGAATQCLDEMLLRSGASPPGRIRLVPSPLFDASGKVGAATMDMVIVGASKLSERSRFFTPVAPYPNGPDPSVLKASSVYVVRGSITDLTQVESSGLDQGVRVPFFDMGRRRQRQYSALSMTLYFTTLTGDIVPGSLQSLTVVLRQDDKGASMSASVDQRFTLYFGGDEAMAEGPPQAVRAMIELALIEAAGNIAQVPYERCLAQPATAPDAIHIARDRFEKLPVTGQIKAISQALKARGYAVSDAASTMTEPLRAAISQFELTHHMPALGLPTFDVFYALTGPQPLEALAAAPRLTGGPAPRIAPIGPGLTYVDATGGLAASAGARLRFGITVAEPAYVSCLYVDEFDRSVLVYPNRQRPESLLRPGETLRVPGQDDLVSLDITRPSTSTAQEALVCFAGLRPIRQDLEALLGPPLSSTPAATVPAAQLADVVTKKVPGISANVFSFTIH